MTWTKATLTLGLAWIAVGFLMKHRGAEAAYADDGLAPFPSVDPGLPHGFGGELFKSTTQDRPTARAPGLFDFARGA